MPVVEVRERVAAPVETVWNAITDVEAQSSLFGHVRSVELHESGEGYRVLAWEVDVKGCAMRWVERQELDESARRIDYRLVEGDLAQWEGSWQITPRPDDAVDVALTVRFDIGVPALSDMLDPVAERAIRANSQAMLQSLATHAGAAAV